MLHVTANDYSGNGGGGSVLLLDDGYRRRISRRWERPGLDRPLNWPKGDPRHGRLPPGPAHVFP